eukprot:4336168-Heterocapsa_arctica.AAC.1
MQSPLSDITAMDALAPTDQSSRAMYTGAPIGARAATQPGSDTAEQQSPDAVGSPASAGNPAPPEPKDGA